MAPYDRRLQVREGQDRVPVTRDVKSRQSDLYERMNPLEKHDDRLGGMTRGYAVEKAVQVLKQGVRGMVSLGGHKVFAAT
jgi:hypothetical protein